MKKIFCIGLILIFTGELFANIKNGNIAGEIIDKNIQQPLAGASVVVENSSKGASTDMEGRFFISDLHPGSYNLTIHYMGYRTVLKSNVVVNPAKTTVMRIEMVEDVLNSDEIEVTASYFTRPKEAVVSSRSMDFEEIRRSPGSFLDIQRVVQALPAVVSGSDQINEIITRGGNPGENLFLLDEIEIPNPNHFGIQGAGGGPINMINTLMVREVDFYAGAFSAKYGDKSSSTMDISLRQGSKEGFAATFDMSMAGLGFMVEGPISRGQGSYMISARKSYLDLISSGIGLTAVPRYYDVQAKVNYDLSNKNILTFNAIYGANAINIEDDGKGKGGYSRNAENVDTNGKQYAVGLTLKTLWNPLLYSNTTLSFVQSNWFADVYHTENRKTYFKNNSKEQEVTLKTDFVWQAAKPLELNWGVSYKDVNFDHDLNKAADTLFIYDRTGSDPDTIIGIERIYPAWENHNEIKTYKVAAYAQISYDFLRYFMLTAGARVNYFDYNDYFSFSPRLGLSCHLTPKTTISFAYGKHYQSPAYVNFSWNEKNRNLINYYSDQYILGFEKLIGKDIKFTAEGYYKKYENIPVFKRYTTTDPYDHYQNEMLSEGKGESYGIELFFQKKLTDRFSSIISYAYSESKYKDLRYDVDYPGDYDYRHVFTFIAGHKTRFYEKKWFQETRKKWWYKAFAWLLPLADEQEFSIKFRYLGGRPYTLKTYQPQHHEWIVEPTQPFNGDRLPAYHRLDIRWDRRFFFDNWNLVMYFDFTNVYGQKNIWEYQYSEDGTKGNIYQFKTLPIGGVIIEL